MTVLVFGSTGNIGPHVVRSLVAQGAHVRVITRDEAKARAVLPVGVDIVQGDIWDPGTVQGALDGVESAFLLTPHAYTMAELQLRIIRELRRTGIKIVKLSGTSSAVGPNGPQAMRQHWEVETILRASGQPYVILRSNAFMQTMINQNMLPTIKATGKMPNAIASSGLSMIDARDVGAVAAQALTENTWDGETLVLTGPRAVTYYEIADHIGSVRGQQIEVLEITPADVRASFLARGLELWEAEHFEEVYQVFRDGESEFVSDDVKRVTGSEPGTVEAYLEANAAAFRS